MEFGFWGIVILGIIISVLNRVFGSKKGNDQANSTKQQQAVEEQERRRESYESAQNEIAKPTAAKIIRDSFAEVFGESERDLPLSSRKEAPASAETMRKPITLVRELDTMQQTSVAANEPASPIASTAQTTANAVIPSYIDQPATSAYAIDATPWIADTIYELYPNRHRFTKQELKQGIIMAEILGPCRAKAKRKYQ